MGFFNSGPGGKMSIKETDENAASVQLQYRAERRPAARRWPWYILGGLILILAGIVFLQITEIGK
jgi:hypothetical protein